MKLFLKTIIGIEKALSYHINPIIAVLMGLFTAVMGGVTRDIMCNEIPLIFRKEIYAIACIAGGVSYLAFRFFCQLDETLNLFITISIIIIVRTISMRYKLSLPILKNK